MRTSVTTAVLATLLGLSACGGDDTASDGAEPTVESAAAEPSDQPTDDAADTPADAPVDPPADPPGEADDGVPNLIADNSFLVGGPDDFPFVPFPDVYRAGGALWMAPESGGGENGAFVGTLSIVDSAATPDELLADLQAFYENEGFGLDDSENTADLSLTNGELVVGFAVRGGVLEFFATTP